MTTETLTTVKSGCACLDGLIIFVHPDIAVPVHVVEHDPCEPAVRTENSRPTHQEIEEVVEHIIEGVKSAALCHDLQLELFHRLLVGCFELLVDGVVQELSYDGHLFEVKPSERRPELFRHVVDLIFFLQWCPGGWERSDLRPPIPTEWPP